MCELLVTRGNEVGHTFPKTAYELARTANDDGAGYALFENISKGKWDVVDIAIFPEKYSYKAPETTYENAYGYRDTAGHWHPKVHRAPLLPDKNKEKDDSSGTNWWDEHKRKQEEEDEKTDDERFIEYMERQEERELGYENGLMLDNLRVGGYHKPTPTKIANLLPEPKVLIKPKKEHKHVIVPVTNHIKVKGFEPKGFFQSYVDRVPDKIFEVQEKVTKNQLLVSHFRMATSGGNVEQNTHPLIHGDYLVIHNGVFGYHYTQAGKSDTRIFIEKLHTKSHLKGITTPKAERQLIEQLLEKAGGYYSVFIYSWKTKQLYYYKTKVASFHWDVTGLLGATRVARFPVTHFEAQSFLVQ